jgi:hypothetical protein
VVLVAVMDLSQEQLLDLEQPWPLELLDKDALEDQ